MTCPEFGSTAWWKRIPTMTSEYLNSAAETLRARGDYEKAAKVAAVALHKYEHEQAQALGITVREYQDMQAAENKRMLEARRITHVAQPTPDGVGWNSGNLFARVAEKVEVCNE